MFVRPLVLSVLAWGCTLSPSTGSTNPPAGTTPSTTASSGTTSTALPEWSEPALGACDRTANLAMTARCTAGIVALHDGLGYADLAAAVDVASDGDTVWVCPGDHTASVELASRTLTIAAVESDAVTLEGDGTHRIATATSATVTLDNLTLTGGRAWEPGSKADPANYGGAVLAFDSVLTVRCASIHSNEAFNGGGGIFASGSTLEVVDSEIHDNATVDFYGSGIGFNTMHWFETPAQVLEPATDLVLDGVTLTDNGAATRNGETLEPVAFGLQVWVDEVSSIVVRDSEVRDHAGGGALLTGGGTVLVESTTIADNDGPGLVAYPNGDADLVDLEVTGNVAGYFGGGLQLGFYPSGAGTITVDGGVISGNESDTGAAIGVRRVSQDKGEPNGAVVLDSVEITSNVSSDKDGAAVVLWRGSSDVGAVDLTIIDSDFGLGKLDNDPLDVSWDGTVIDDVAAKGTVTIP